jgi:glutamate-1-semialdehyde aminotransferase
VPLGVRPDIAAYSKAIANGYPLAAVLGSDALRDAASRVFATGSFWFAAVPMAASLATLESLQELTRVVVAQRTGMRPRIVVDVEDYRKRQLDRLVARAREVAKRVASSGREEALEPMNPFMRKVVHDAVAGGRGGHRREGVEPSGTWWCVPR